MGSVFPGVPQDFTKSFAAMLRIGCFIETGTNQGGTAAWAADHFQTVHTVERDPGLYAACKARLGHRSNLNLLQGHSVDCLMRIVGDLKESAVFWLDAHYSGEGTSGADDECPLIREISAINASAFPHLILIDDARLFLAPPPPPHDVNQWPDIGQILRVLDAGPYPRYTAVVADVVISVPVAWKPTLLSHIRVGGQPIA